MKQVSKKRRALMNQVDEARQVYRMEFTDCALCGEPASELHEICRGAAREKALRHPEAWLSVCQSCHRDELATMSVARQLVLKFLQSREYYDRPLINVIRGRDPDAVSEAEVLHELHKIDEWR